MPKKTWKLNPNQLEEIMRMLAENRHTQQYIADVYEVTRCTISNIKRDEKYRSYLESLKSAKPNF